MYKGSGCQFEKTSGTTQRQGTAYRIYGCGMLGNVNKPQILIPLETLCAFLTKIKLKMTCNNVEISVHYFIIY